MAIQGGTPDFGQGGFERELQEAEANSKAIEILIGSHSIQVQPGQAKFVGSNLIVNAGHERLVVPFHAIVMMKVR